MSPSLALLAWSPLLLMLYVGAQSLIDRAERGLDFAVGSRDDAVPRSVRLGRAERALRNFLETYAGFVALSAAIVLAGHGGGLATAGAVVYILARIAYLPLYVCGVRTVRSLAWLVSMLGLVLMFVAAVA